MREASAFLEEKVRKNRRRTGTCYCGGRPALLFRVVAAGRSDSEIQRFGVGPWEDESPTCIDTAIKRPPAPIAIKRDAPSLSVLNTFVNTGLDRGGGGAQGTLRRGLNRERVEHAQVRVRDVAVRQRRPVEVRRLKSDRDVARRRQRDRVAPVAHIIIDAVAVGRRHDLEVVRMQVERVRRVLRDYLTRRRPCAC